MYNPIDMGSELESNQILPQLKTQWLGKRYRFFPEIGSTNTAVLTQNRASPLPEGTVFVTEHQSQGKGRLGRGWSAPSGSSLLFSVLLKPNWGGNSAAWLTMMGCLAAIEAIEAETAVSPKIKWPNDLVVMQNGVWHKTAGILVEGAFDAQGRLETAVFGMGLNVNIAQAQLPDAHTPATSLRIAQGAAVDRAALFVRILENLEKRYELVKNGRSPLAEWKAKLITLGNPVHVTNIGNNQTISGIAEDVDEHGHLLIRDAKSQRHTVQAGDVTLRAPL